MLQRRKVKKEKLQTMLGTLGDQKISQDETYQEKIFKIH
jgi:hypothetical protein